MAAFNQAEMKSFYDVSETKAAAATPAAGTVLDEKELEALSAEFGALMEDFKFTGYDPASFKHYLESKVFVAPAFTKSTAAMAVGMIIALYIQRGSKLSAKNETRMGEKGKAAVRKLEDALGANFKKNYDAGSLTDKTITPARVAACMPMLTAKMIQKHKVSPVGAAPVGLPKGLANSVSFGIIPDSCTRLHHGMSLWRDNFSNVVNPRASSPDAKKLAQISAYNFSELARKSGFISQVDRHSAVAELAYDEFKSGRTNFDKYMTIMWVDDYDALRLIVNGTVAEMDTTSLNRHPFKTDFVRTMPGAIAGPLVTILNNLNVTDDMIRLAKIELNKPSIEDRVSQTELDMVGNFGTRDQGRSYEQYIRGRAYQQPGMPFAPSQVQFTQQIPMPPMPSPQFLQGLPTSSPSGAPYNV